jgi:hypothetical protein
MFTPGKSGNPSGRKKGTKNERTKILDLLSEETLTNAFVEDFNSGDKFARQLAYEHWLGKPENVNKNLDMKFPDYIKMVNGPKQKEESNGPQS